MEDLDVVTEIFGGGKALAPIGWLLMLTVLDWLLFRSV